MESMRPTAAEARRRKRGRALRAAVLALGLLLGGTAAHAADTCFQDGIGDISVFKKYKTPRPGDCAPITGFTNNSLATLDGTTCGTSDGAWVIINFTYMINATKFGTGHFEINRATGAGNGHGCDGRTDGNAWGCSTFAVNKIVCPKPATFRF